MKCLIFRYQEEDQMRMLEEEQDRLNNSLLSLTTHFAQVQFRLNQIVEAPTEHKEVWQTSSKFSLWFVKVH